MFKNALLSTVFLFSICAQAEIHCSTEPIFDSEDIRGFWVDNSNLIQIFKMGSQYKISIGDRHGETITVFDTLEFCIDRDLATTHLKDSRGMWWYRLNKSTIEIAERTSKTEPPHSRIFVRMIF